jgi:hypothetical protein
VSRHPGYHFERIDAAEGTRPDGMQNGADYLICAEGLSSCDEFLALRDVLRIGTQESRAGKAGRLTPDSPIAGPTAPAIAVTRLRRRSIGG